MKRFCYVIVNNAGHSWSVLTNESSEILGETSPSVLPQLLGEGWQPIRETPMGGGSSPLAHSLVLLERNHEMMPGRKRGRRAR
jgi:hypothetical protein